MSKRCKRTAPSWPPAAGTPPATGSAPEAAHAPPLASPNPALSPSDPRAPKYWMWETSGVLRAAVEHLLGDPRELSAGQVAVLKMYLRQWIMAPVWQGNVEGLRQAVERIQTGRDIEEWVVAAVDAGCDPL